MHVTSAKPNIFVRKFHYLSILSYLKNKNGMSGTLINWSEKTESYINISLNETVIIN